MVAQHGSSGGAVVSREGKLIGVIVTSSAQKTTGERSLHALALSHIEKRLEKQAGQDIGSFLAGDIAIHSQMFNRESAPALKQKLLDVLTNQ